MSTIFLKKSQLQSLQFPKNAQKIEETEIVSKYERLTNEKGTNGLSMHYSYFITDEWVEVKKPNADKLPEKDRNYLALVTVLYDKEGNVKRKGTVSVNKLTQPFPSYSENGIIHIQQITNIPSFDAEPLSILDYLKKHLIGKFLKNTGETFNTINIDYSFGTPSLYGVHGEQLKERRLPFYKVEEIKEEEQ